MIHVDQSVGAAIAMFLRGTQKERPLTHERGTYFARLILSAENELHQRKTIEIDARPSDCIAMATQHSAPVYVTGEVWEEVEDMAEVLRKIEDESSESGESDEDNK